MGYNTIAIENLIDRYIEQDGQVYILEEGVLGFGIVVCTGDKLKNCVIKEKFLNDWSSVHTVRFYRTLPKKYLDRIANL